MTDLTSSPQKYTIRIAEATMPVNLDGGANISPSKAYMRNTLPPPTSIIMQQSSDDASASQGASSKPSGKSRKNQQAPQLVPLHMLTPEQQYEYARKVLRKRKKKLFAFEGTYTDITDDRQELMQMFLNINKAAAAGNKRSTIRDIGSFKNASARRPDYEDDPDYEFHEAVRRKQENKKHSDFFMRLHGLKEKIDLFNEVFKIDVPMQKRRTLRSHRLSQILTGQLVNASTFQVTGLLPPSSLQKIYNKEDSINVQSSEVTMDLQVGGGITSSNKRKQFSQTGDFSQTLQNQIGRSSGADDGDNSGRRASRQVNLNKSPSKQSDSESQKRFNQTFDNGLKAPYNHPSKFKLSSKNVLPSISHDFTAIGGLEEILLGDRQTSIKEEEQLTVADFDNLQGHGKHSSLPRLNILRNQRQQQESNLQNISEGGEKSSRVNSQDKVDERGRKVVAPLPLGQHQLQNNALFRKSKFVGQPQSTTNATSSINKEVWPAPQKKTEIQKIDDKIERIDIKKKQTEDKYRQKQQSQTQHLSTVGLPTTSRTNGGSVAAGSDVQKMSSLTSEVYNTLSTGGVLPPAAASEKGGPHIQTVKPLLIKNNNNRSPRVIEKAVITKDQTIKSIYEMGRIVIQESSILQASPKPKRKRRKNKSPLKEGSITRGMLPNLVDSAELSIERVKKGGSKSQANHRRRHSQSQERAALKMGNQQIKYVKNPAHQVSKSIIKSPNHTQGLPIEMRQQILNSYGYSNQAQALNNTLNAALTPGSPSRSHASNHKTTAPNFPRKLKSIFEGNQTPSVVTPTTSRLDNRQIHQQSIVELGEGGASPQAKVIVATHNQDDSEDLHYSSYIEDHSVETKQTVHRQEKRKKSKKSKKHAGQD